MSAIYLARSALASEHRAILQHGSEPAVRSGAGAHLRNIALGLPDVAHFGHQWLFQRLLARRKLPYTLAKNKDGSFPLEFNCEQTPLAGSRVTLGNDTDPDGLRRVDVKWQLCTQDVEAAHRGLLLLQSELELKSSCRIQFNEPDLEQALTRSIPLGGHHIGTARMGASPRTGVVDRDCALFESPNVYVASSAVFCTAGHANPTLSIVAFALRIADQLKRVAAAAPAVHGQSPRTAASQQPDGARA